jgi:integrase
MSPKINYLTPEEYPVFLYGLGKSHRQTRLIIGLFLLAGMKMAEVLDMKIIDLVRKEEPADYIVAREGKRYGGGTRIIPVEVELSFFIESWFLKVVKQRKNWKYSDPAFPSRGSGGTLSRRGIEMTLVRATNKIIGRTISAVALRNTYGIELAKKHDLKTVEKMMGLRSEGAAQRIKDLSEAV